MQITLQVIKDNNNSGGANYIMHLAGYYDVSQKDNPADTYAVFISEPYDGFGTNLAL